MTSRTESPHPIPAHIDLLRRHTVHTSTVRGYRLACLDNGDGPPVILLHGLGGSMWHWEHQQDALTRSHRVLTPDMPGAGLSDKPDVDYAPVFLLDTLCALMDNRRIRRAAFIGNSLGAGLAIGMSLAHPKRVSALVLISGLPANVLHNMNSPAYKHCIQTRLPRWLITWGMRIAGRGVSRRILKEMLYDHTLITPLVEERAHRIRLRRGAMRAIYSHMAQLPKWETDFAPRLADIPHPTLILWGARDNIFPPAVGRALRQTIPGSAFLEIPDAGHVPQWEQPGAVNPAILRFLARHTATPSAPHSGDTR